jgi:hypothetical protein
LLCFFIIKNNILDLLFHFVSNIVTLLNRVDQLCEYNVVIDDFSKLREMPREPLLQSHNKSIDVFIQLLDKGNGLHNWFILPVHILSASLSGVTVCKTELGSGHISVSHAHELGAVGSDTSVELTD